MPPIADFYEYLSSLEPAVFTEPPAVSNETDKGKPAESPTHHSTSQEKSSLTITPMLIKDKSEPEVRANTDATAMSVVP